MCYSLTVGPVSIGSSIDCIVLVAVLYLYCGCSSNRVGHVTTACILYCEYPVYEKDKLVALLILCTKVFRGPHAHTFCVFRGRPHTHVFIGGDPTLTHCCVYGGGPTLIHCCVYRGRLHTHTLLLRCFLQKPNVNHKKAIKEYSGSAADKVTQQPSLVHSHTMSPNACTQEEPLPHDLRPLSVLQMTMDYLVTRVMDDYQERPADWYDFVWNRTRGIRKV